MAVERYLKIKEFQGVAGIGRSTVFERIRTGKYREGVHYIYDGGLLRFPYPQCLEAPLEAARKSARAARKPESEPQSRARAARTATGTAVNQDWLP